jgi:hypothetical protein
LDDEELELSLLSKIKQSRRIEDDKKTARQTIKASPIFEEQDELI